MVRHGLNDGMRGMGPGWVAWANFFARGHPIADTGKLSLSHSALKSRMPDRNRTNIDPRTRFAPPTTVANFFECKSRPGVHISHFISNSRTNELG